MRTAKIMLAVLFCATMARAETLEGLSRRIDDIALGRDTGNQIQDLRVQDDATIGDDLTVSGDAAVTGAATVTGKTTANGELEANADVDINLGSATEEITIDQTNAAGTAATPMIAVTDARTGATANSTNEATLWIRAQGSYALCVDKGAASMEETEFSGTYTEVDSSAGIFRVGYPADLGWQLSTVGGGATLQFATDFARTGAVVRATLTSTTMTVSNLTSLGQAVVFSALPTTTNGFSVSGSCWNSNGYFCVWTP